jgi:hypothetical protein
LISQWKEIISEGVFLFSYDCGFTGYLYVKILHQSKEPCSIQNKYFFRDNYTTLFTIALKKEGAMVWIFDSSFELM